MGTASLSVPQRPSEPLSSVFQVKKQMRDLEAKVKDQEEELDEQAGTIQMLEQVHLHFLLLSETGSSSARRCSALSCFLTPPPGRNELFLHRQRDVRLAQR